LHIYLDSNSKNQLPHIQIDDNNCNNRVDMDSNRMTRMQMWILLITASAFSPLMETINSCDILHNVDFNFFEAFGLYEIMEISSSKMRPMVSGLDR
jgi:hypothetical protein